MYGLTLLRWQQIFTPKCGRKLLIVHTHAMRTLSRYFYECIFTYVGDNNKNSKYNYPVLI